MNNNELAEILEKLKKLPCDKLPYYIRLNSDIEQYSVETLELLAVKLYEEYSRKNLIKDRRLLEMILLERFIKLNRSFEWTKENKERLIKVNDKITQVFENAYNEAVPIAKELENRLNNNDDFIKDYEIEIKLRLFMGDEFYDDGNCGIGSVLSEMESGYYPINYLLVHDLSEKPIYLDRSENWNIEYFGNTFDNDYIGYAIHALLDTSRWSFKDIININSIWADVEVKHQCFVENI
jgi:hypothetical protein